MECPENVKIHRDKGRFIVFRGCMEEWRVSNCKPSLGVMRTFWSSIIEACVTTAGLEVMLSTKYLSLSGSGTECVNMFSPCGLCSLLH